MKTDPKRIAVLAHTHPSISKGGSEIVAYNLFNALVDLGVDAIFVAACERENAELLELGSGREYAVLHDPADYERLYHLAPLGLGQQVLEILRARRVQLANFHHFLNFGINTLRVVARAPEIGSVLTFHEMLTICHHDGQMVTRPGKFLCNKASPGACGRCFPEKSSQQFELRRSVMLDVMEDVDGFVSPSAFLAQRLSDWGLPSQRMYVVENGLARVLPARPATLPGDDGTWVIGFFGQITPFKGVDVLLHAAELIARRPGLASRIQLRIHGDIVGQPPAFRDQIAVALERYPFLSYSGPYSNDQVSALMSACHYVLVPSLWWENSPVVIQEAFAAGRPVLCSGIGGMAEKVADGISGIHFQVGSAADLAQTIAAAADCNVFEKLRAGVPPVHDARAMAQKYLGIFNAVWDSYGAPGRRSKQREIGSLATDR